MPGGGIFLHKEDVCDTLVAAGCDSPTRQKIENLYTLAEINANSAFHPYGVDKLSTYLPGWGEDGAVTSVGWQITVCDPIDKWRPVVLR